MGFIGVPSLRLQFFGRRALEGRFAAGVLSEVD